MTNALRRPGAEGSPSEKTFHAYNSPEFVSWHSRWDDLMPCERFLFTKYLKPPMRILDLGVGAGRTTRYLASISAQYVGIDIAPEMIRECKRKFPSLDIRVMNAADLEDFRDSVFDAVVFSGNGIDYLYPDEERWRCLREVFRVLRPEGLFILSVHNLGKFYAKGVKTSVRMRIESMVSRILKPDSVIFPAIIFLICGLGVPYVWVRSVCERIVQRAPMLFKGAGFFSDRVTGGLLTHVATPTAAIGEMSRFGFRVLERVRSDFPTDSCLPPEWYYYVCLK
jgi:SAM-dependent methyltransferase